MKLLILLLILVCTSCMKNNKSNSRASVDKSEKDQVSEFLNEEIQGLNPFLRGWFLRSRELLSKNCFYATYSIDETLEKTKIKDQKSFDSYPWKPEIFHCVGDFEYKAGTIYATKGCALLSFNIGRGAIAPFFNQYFETAMVTKQCSKGGFEELISKKGTWSYSTIKGGTVQTAMFDDDWKNEKTTLIHTERIKDVEWFKAARAKAISKRKK